MATYDTWGGSWGASWATSWFRGTTPPPPVVVTQPSGGIPYTGDYAAKIYADIPRPPSKEEIRRQREALGILPGAVEVIERVAERQASETAERRLDDEQRIQELARELQAQAIEWDSKYLEILAEEREKRMVAEIAELAVVAKQAIEVDNAARIALLLMIL